jgi:16S rRNA (uracil1498-N3)-methyltransferase
MPFNRFFYDGPLTEGTEVELEEKELHHLLHVTRTGPGETIELVNGKGELAHARVEKAGRGAALLTLLSVQRQPLPLQQRILAQALCRFNRLEWIIEKAVELGCTQIWFFPAKLSDLDELSGNKQERLRYLAISAMKQCGRLDLPHFELLPSLDKWRKPEGALLFGDTRPSAPPLHKELLQERTIFCIGPESGLHSDEVDILESNLGAHGVKLHTNILRVETASLVALSLLDHLSSP